MFLGIRLGLRVPDPARRGGGGGVQKSYLSSIGSQYLWEFTGVCGIFLPGLWDFIRVLAASGIS